VLPHHVRLVARGMANGLRSCGNLRTEIAAFPVKWLLQSRRCGRFSTRRKQAVKLYVADAGI